MKIPKLLFSAFLLTTILVSNRVAAQQGGNPVVWSVVQSQDEAHPGDQLILAVVATVSAEMVGGAHWHFYPREEEHSGDEIATQIQTDCTHLPVTLGSVQWPEPIAIVNASGKEQMAYEGMQYFYIPTVVDVDAIPGEYTLNIAVRYQVCSSYCLPPTTINLSATIRVVPSDVTIPDIHLAGELFSEFDATVFAEMATVDHAKPEDIDTEEEDNATLGSSDFGADKTAPPRESISVPLLGELKTTGSLGLLLVVLLAFIGGTILNLMPCVLPIIPIKIMGLTQASGSRQKSILLGFMMLIGVTVLWLVIGFAIISIKRFDSVSSLFQLPLFSIGVGIFILGMGIGMMGLFTVQLPQFVYRVNPRHDSPVGAFGFGIMAAILSTPCTAPFMGASITWATQAQSMLTILAVFSAIGIGMGWPYLVLAAFPSLVQKVPRTGPASELVKQVLGLVMIAAAVFFTGAGLLGLLRQYPYLGAVLYWWLTTGVVGVMVFWLILRSFQITSLVGRRILITVIGLGLFTGMGWFAYSQTQAEYFKHTHVDVWVDYDETAFENSREDGRITIVDFTADW